jgi:hypothetical protein
MSFDDTPMIKQFIENFIIFKDKNINLSDLFSYENKLEYMLNIDVIDEEIFTKYNANIIDRLLYYENIIKVSSFILDDLFTNKKLSSIIYCIIYFELYKKSLYDQVLDYCELKKEYSLHEYLLRKNLLNKLIDCQAVCKNNVYTMYNNILLNYDIRTELYKDCTNLIKDNGNILNLK